MYAGLFIVLCWAIFLLYWTMTASSVKPTIARQSLLWPLVRLAILLVMALVLMTRGPLTSYTHRVILPRTPVVGCIADLIALAGLLVMLWARTVLGRNWSASVVFKEQHELVERGPYQYVRHPIYSGLLLLILGTVVLYGRVGGFIIFVLSILGFWFKARLEERLLTQYFPDAYPRYRARVKGLIPFVW